MCRGSEISQILKFLHDFQDSFYEVKEIPQEEAPEDSRFLEIALKEALKAKHTGEVPVGALLVINEQIISRAHNHVEARRDPTAHAELMVIKESLRKTGKKYLSGAILYVTLEPCLMCFKAASLARIHKIVFMLHSDEGFTNYPVKSAYPRQITKITGNLSETYEKILKDFFEKLRQKQRQ